MMVILDNGTAVFNNSNEKQYVVIETNFVHGVALLKPLKPTFEQAPYMVASGFNTKHDSWDGGTYDMTREQAQEVFNKKTLK